MESLSCSAALVLAYILRAFQIALVIYAVISWVPNLRGNWTVYLDRIVEPVLTPVRRLIPPVGGLDLSFLVIFFLVSYLINQLPIFVCSLGER